MKGSLTSPLATLTRSITNCLQVEQFRDFIGGYRAGFWAQPHYRWEVTDAPVQFGQQHKGDGRVARRINEQWPCLPFSRAQLYGIDDSTNLRFERLRLVDLHRNSADLVDGGPGECFDLRWCSSVSGCVKFRMSTTLSPGFLYPDKHTFL